MLSKWSASNAQSRYNYAMLLFESTYFIFFVVISIYYSYISAHCHLTKKEVTTDITQHMVNRTSQHINSTSTDNRNTTLVVETYASKKLLPNGLIYIILLLGLVLTICFRVWSISQGLRGSDPKIALLNRANFGSYRISNTNYYD